MAIRHHQRGMYPTFTEGGIRRSGEVHCGTDLLQLGMCSEGEPKWQLKIMGHLLVFVIKVNWYNILWGIKRTRFHKVPTLF